MKSRQIMQDIISNFESLSEDKTSKYAGEWVAIVNNKIVVHSTSFKEVYDFIKKNYQNEKPLIGRLPEANPIVLSIS
ncbi:MAG: DUF5678 domain-containing protein [Nanoarchaeota archaeon]